MLSITRKTGRSAADGRARRVRAPLAISLAVNAVLVVAFFQAAARGYTWRDLFDRPDGEVPAERISFFRLPAGERTQAGRSGGDGRPVSRGQAAPRPRPVPPSAPAAPAAPATPPDAPVTPGVGTRPGPGGSGAVVGEGGPAEGIRPTYADPRLWARPDVAVSAPKSAKERADSVTTATLGPVRDSILAAREIAAGQRKPGDWTVKGPGGTWGMDQRNIHLGKVKVPTALLALLSSNFQNSLRSNPVTAANDRRLADVRRDLLDHAQREIAEDDFRGAVRSIRQRKDRERAARLAARRGGSETPTVADVPVGQGAAAAGATPR